MFGIGIGEIILILIIGMLVVGPERMVEFSRQAGRLVARLKRETDSVSQEFREALDLSELQSALTEAQNELQGVAKDLDATSKEATTALASAQQEAQALGKAANMAPATAGTGGGLTPAPVPAASVIPTAAAIAAGSGLVASPSARVQPLLDGEVRPEAVRQAGAPTPEAEPSEPEDSIVQELGVPELVVEDAETAPIEIGEPLLVMDKEAMEEIETAVNEATTAATARVLDEQSDVDQDLSPEEAVAQALGMGASVVAEEAFPDEGEEDVSDEIVAWETGVRLPEEEPIDGQPEDSSIGDVIVADLPDQASIKDMDEAPGPEDIDVEGKGKEVQEAPSEAVDASSDDPVEDGESEG